MMYSVYVISAGRHDKLPFTKKQKQSYIFCVKKGEKKLYQNSGCKNVYLMGVPPTSNDFFAKNKISKNTFCIGDMLFIKPNPLRFDTSLTLKEDYDYTLQHLHKYGNTFRYQKYLFEFEHYKNKGGAVDYRTEKEERKNIMILKSKWGDKVKLNPKRKNEILI